MIHKVEPQEYWVELEGKIDGPAMVYSELVDGLDENALHLINYQAYSEAQELVMRLKEVLKEYTFEAAYDGGAAAREILNDPHLDQGE